ncbi:hypothetical protein AV530_003855 [Patagioenas fasciata monilis]|uniref:Uncharacterized protein n=1 Tax=Patagioenas fasciata monilis TaxID=372326 RepID=A0A1V4L0D8_PATFA|nr:hypothetical protein AV530_003855 [Patagioenas fasciata monilis]
MLPCSPRRPREQARPPLAQGLPTWAACELKLEVIVLNHVYKVRFVKPPQTTRNIHNTMTSNIASFHQVSLQNPSQRLNVDN